MPWRWAPAGRCRSATRKNRAVASPLRPAWRVRPIVSTREMPTERAEGIGSSALLRPYYPGERMEMGSGAALFEQIVERLPCAGRTLRACLALDGGPRRKQRAFVSRILRSDACGQRLRALEPRAGVERDALDTTVEIDAAARAPAVGADRHRQTIAAARAAEDLVRRHQIRRLRTLRPLARRLRLLRLGCRPLAVSRLVLIAALSVLSVAVTHVRTRFAHRL